MAYRDIRIIGDPILRTQCEWITSIDDSVKSLVDDLLETVDEDGRAGLAANQIGVAKQVIAYRDDDQVVHVMYNPRIMMGLGASKLEEGCLTREGTVRVTRYAKVKVSFDELVEGSLKARRRDYTGWVAEMIQHMCDHCNGKLV